MDRLFSFSQSDPNKEQEPTNCLSVFDCFVGLALKRLSHLILNDIYL